MQPIQYASDAAIREQYESLCSRICIWVDQFCDDDGKPLHETFCIRWDADLYEFLESSIGETGVRLSADYQEASPAMMEYFLHTSLQYYIFRYHGCCLGLTKQQEKLLANIKDNIPQSTPKRSELLIRSWNKAASDRYLPHQHLEGRGLSSSSTRPSGESYPL
jgi:hypothetical protein